MVLTYPSPVPRPVAIILLVLCAACGSHPDASHRAAAGRENQARDLARRAGLSVDVQDFLVRYASAAANRFEVTYAPSATGTTVVLVQDPPRRRVDLVTPPVTRSVFVTKDGTFDCALDNQKWTCQKSAQQESPPGLLAPADVQRTVTQLQSSKADYTFKVTDRKVAATSARCLLITPRRSAPPGSTPSTLCLSSQGAVLLVEGAGTPLRAARYSTSVDTRRLQLPTTPEPALPTP
jgi:hypothetical protein